MTIPHPIITIRWRGSILVQGERVEPSADMSGLTCVRVGGQTYCGDRVEPVRRPAPHPVSGINREDREPAPPMDGRMRATRGSGED